MSVKTEADERIERAAKSVDEAIKELIPVVFGECWGANSFNEIYESKLSDCLLKLKSIKKILEK